jgi:hypothetical protein
MENNMQMDIKTLLEGYANSVIMMMGVVEASQEAFKMKKEEKNVTTEESK